MNVGMKVLIAWSCACMFLVMGGFPIAADNPIQHYVDINYTTETVQNINETNLTENVGLDFDAGGSIMPSGVNIFMTGAHLVRNALVLIGGFFFVPITALTGVGAPFQVFLILGVIPIIILALAVIGFIRGKDF